MLEIHNIQPEDAGEYVCRASNILQSSKPNVIQLNVEGKQLLWKTGLLCLLNKKIIIMGRNVSKALDWLVLKAFIS